MSMGRLRVARTGLGESSRRRGTSKDRQGGGRVVSARVRADVARKASVLRQARVVAEGHHSRGLQTGLGLSRNNGLGFGMGQPHYLVERADHGFTRRRPTLPPSPLFPLLSLKQRSDSFLKIADIDRVIVWGRALYLGLQVGLRDLGVWIWENLDPRPVLLRRWLALEFATEGPALDVALRDPRSKDGPLSTFMAIMGGAGDTLDVDDKTPGNVGGLPASNRQGFRELFLGTEEEDLGAELAGLGGMVDSGDNLKIELTIVNPPPRKRPTSRDNTPAKQKITMANAIANQSLADKIVIWLNSFLILSKPGVLDIGFTTSPLQGGFVRKIEHKPGDIVGMVLLTFRRNSEDATREGFVFFHWGPYKGILTVIRSNEYVRLRFKINFRTNGKGGQRVPLAGYEDLNALVDGWKMAVLGRSPAGPSEGDLSAPHQVARGARQVLADMLPSRWPRDVRAVAGILGQPLTLVNGWYTGIGEPRTWGQVRDDICAVVDGRPTDAQIEQLAKITDRSQSELEAALRPSE